MATERSTYSGMPHWRSFRDVFWPDRHQLLVAPLDHNRYRKRVEAGLIELNRSARHRFGPAAFETDAVQSLGYCFRLCRLRTFDRLHEHVESHRVPDRFLHHEVAEAITERVRQRGRQMAARKTDMVKIWLDSGGGLMPKLPL